LKKTSLHASVHSGGDIHDDDGLGPVQQLCAVKNAVTARVELQLRSVGVLCKHRVWFNQIVICVPAMTAYGSLDLMNKKS
jgi:hypothetical protein